jgi:hypothetical protein
MSVAVNGGAVNIDVSAADYEATGEHINGFTIYVGTGGDVKGDTINGDTVTYKNIPSGHEKATLFKKIYSVGTTAADIVVQWH